MDIEIIGDNEHNIVTEDENEDDYVRKSKQSRKRKSSTVMKQRSKKPKIDAAAAAKAAEEAEGSDEEISSSEDEEEGEEAAKINDDDDDDDEEETKNDDEEEAKNDGDEEEAKNDGDDEAKNDSEEPKNEEGDDGDESEVGESDIVSDTEPSTPTRDEVFTGTPIIPVKKVKKNAKPKEKKVTYYNNKDKWNAVVKRAFKRLKQEEDMIKMLNQFKHRLFNYDSQTFISRRNLMYNLIEIVHDHDEGQEETVSSVFTKDIIDGHKKAVASGRNKTRRLHLNKGQYSCNGPFMTHKLVKPLITRANINCLTNTIELDPELKGDREFLFDKEDGVEDDKNNPLICIERHISRLGEAIKIGTFLPLAFQKPFVKILADSYIKSNKNDLRCLFMIEQVIMEGLVTRTSSIGKQVEKTMISFENWMDGIVLNYANGNKDIAEQIITHIIKTMKKYDILDKDVSWTFSRKRPHELAKTSEIRLPLLNLQKKLADSKTPACLFTTVKTKRVALKTPDIVTVEDKKHYTVKGLSVYIKLNLMKNSIVPR